MNILNTFLLFFLIVSNVYAQPSTTSPSINIAEEDGSPSTFPYKLKFTNGTVTNNGDGTVSVGIGSTAPASSGGGWTDAGTAVHLITSTDNVGIGTSTPLQKLDINGNLNFSSGGHIGIGITSANDDIALISTYAHTTGTRNGVSVDITHNPASAASGDTTTGLSFASRTAGSQDMTISNGLSGATIHNGTGTLAQAQGGAFSVILDNSGSVSSSYGANYATIVNGSGNITNGIGVQIAPPSYASSGRISSFAAGLLIGNMGNSGTSNSAGLFIQDQSGSSGLNLAGYIEGGMFIYNVNKTAASDFIMNGDTFDSLFSTDASEDDVEIGGHLETIGTAPTLSSCGTTPSISSSATDMGGKVTIGTGVVTSCTVTFASTWDNAPACVINDESQILLTRAVSTTTTLTITSAVTVGGDVISYICMGTE